MQEQAIETIHYFTISCLFTPTDVQLMGLYKRFVDSVVMQLGEDWRIQANLFTEEIIAINTRLQPQHTHAHYNLFNQYLNSFLKGRIGTQHTFSTLTQSQVQEIFLAKVQENFIQEEINQTLTFKTLSLGFCITASEIWNNTFKNKIEKQQKSTHNFRPFAKYSTNLQQGGHWRSFSIEQMGEGQFRKLGRTVEVSEGKLSKAQIYSNMVCFVSQVRMKGGRARILELANEFYLGAFIVWLVFNIKTSFGLSQADYIRYCRYFFEPCWRQEFVHVLKSLQGELDRQWSQLMKDYTVSLHDDLQMLKTCTDRLRFWLQQQWQNTLQSISPCS